MTKLVSLTVRDGPRPGHWLGFRFGDGRVIRLAFKAPFGHCIRW